MSQLDKCLKFTASQGICVLYSHFYLPSEYGIELNFRHLSSCDNIDMIEMHCNSCSCFTKTFFLLEYWEIKLNDCFGSLCQKMSIIFKYKLQKTVSIPQFLTVSRSLIQKFLVEPGRLCHKTHYQSFRFPEYF